MCKSLSACGHGNVQLVMNALITVHVNTTCGA